MDNNDIYLHADIHGATSTVIKLDGSKINDSILKESGEFAASFSTAWSKVSQHRMYFGLTQSRLQKHQKPENFCLKDHL